MVAGPPPRSVGRPASLSDPLSVSWDPAPSRLFWTRGFFCSCSFLFFFVFSPDVFRAAAPGGGRRVCDVCVCVANGLINGRAENNASRAAWSLSRVVLVARQHDCVHAPFAGRGLGAARERLVAHRPSLPLLFACLSCSVGRGRLPATRLRRTVVFRTRTRIGQSWFCKVILETTTFARGTIDSNGASFMRLFGTLSCPFAAVEESFAWSVPKMTTATWFRRRGAPCSSLSHIRKGTVARTKI